MVNGVIGTNQAPYHDMGEVRPDKLQQTRESVRRAVEDIEACFTEGDSAADQIGRACDLMLDFAKQFGVDERHRVEAVLQKGALNELLARERTHELSNEDFRTASAKIRRQVLELTRAMKEDTERHLSRIDAASEGNRTVPAKTVTSVLPPSALRESLESFLKQESGSGVAFRCRGIGKRFGFNGPLIIQNLDIELRNAEITGLVGLNGSGKTTLLRIIGGLLQATTGQREYPELGCGPRDWVRIRRKVAFVAQRPEKWSGTVKEALTLQAACFGSTGERGRLIVDFYIARLGLTTYQHYTWDQLSGGYRTRFELAKAMLSRPKMLILDEPLAALDIPAQLRFLTDLKDFATTFAEPMPVLISSQHIYEVEAIADRMIVIKDGEAIYNGWTKLLGEERAVNGFEVSCDLDLAATSMALSSLDVKSVQRIGPNELFITTDRTVTARQLIDALIGADATVRHFRDTSRSSRMFFEA